MLNQLTIKNVALIDNAEITFSDGLNILSGETGAGKSVILDSINFVLGAKADKSMIRYGEQFCLVEAYFTDLSDEVKAQLCDFDIEDSEEIIIKRKFDIAGNGYIKLNGENVTATMLKKITSLLVDVHGQSEHFILLSKSKQLECIDQSAGVENYKVRLKDVCSDIKELDEKLAKLGGNPDERARRIDILNYQINEIQTAELKDGEEAELLSLNERIRNAEKITNALSVVYRSLSDENGVSDSVIYAEQAIRGVAGLDEKIDSFAERLNNLREEANDIGDCVKDYLDSFDFESVDPDEIEKRLEIYRNLKKKYGSTLEDIEAFYRSAVAERDDLIKSDEAIEQITKAKDKKINEYYKICCELSSARKAYSADFSVRVKEKLADLGMPHADFCVEYNDLPSIEELTAYPSNGLDHIEFMFSANAGEPVKPLSKIISGGEMSRFMLALKTQTGSPCGTYVFDEIDAGISGVTASVVAKNFAQIAMRKQIIAVSHLPQISSMSDKSFFIEKIETDGKTFTTVKALDAAKKVEEIIRLIGGSKTDEISIRHAENMIALATEYKDNLKK